jgi:hypothetical protein
MYLVNLPDLRRETEDKPYKLEDILMMSAFMAEMRLVLPGLVDVKINEITTLPGLLEPTRLTETR